MKQKKDSRSNYERNNKTVMKTHLIDVTVMNIFCLLQFLGGMQSGTYVLITLLLGYLPVFIERHFWKKDRETKAIKHIASYGFGIFYTFCLFTSVNQLVYIFAVPMILVASVYNDEAYLTKINAVVILESLIAVIGGAFTGRFGYINLDYGIIQIVSIILIGAYSQITTKTLKQNYGQILAELSDLSEEMKQGILEMHTDLEKLSGASKLTMSAMEEVSTGTNDTAEAVQNQLLQTQSIQDKTGLVYDSMQHISDSMQKTLAALHAGNEDVAVLVEKVEMSVENGQKVADKLKLLDKSVEEMNSITDVIGTIARQTGLLSLNARIEASHAGEFGKGFAVVASEISEMAGQTSAATTDIAELIKSASLSIEEVVNVIYELIEGIHEERQSTEHTSNSFDLILDNTKSIQKQVEYLQNHMEELKEANKQITDSVETISAVSEEVSAHAAETITAEGENVMILGRVEQRMKQLTDLIEG